MLEPPAVQDANPGRFSYVLDPQLVKVKGSSLLNTSSVKVKGSSLINTSCVADTILPSDEPTTATSQTSETIPSQHSSKTRAALLSNKVFTPWYKRYANVLPEHEQIEFQPYEEIERREEDIAMNFVYGDHWPPITDKKTMKTIRKEALQRHIWYKERMEKRELMEKGKELLRKVSAAESSDTASITSIIANRISGKVLTDNFYGYRLTEREASAAQAITDYLKEKRQRTRRARIIEERRECGFSVWHTKWKLLLKPRNKMILRMMHDVQHKARVRLRFRRVINLVFACNRWIGILAEISGNTSTLVKNIREFANQQTMKIQMTKTDDEKFIFDPNLYRLSTETPVPLSVLYTLTKPWFNRTLKEVEVAISSLQVLRCFAELPANTQRIVAMVAWFIKVPEDKVIIRQSQIAQDYYILMSGKISTTVLAGEPHGSGPGLFRHLNTYTKDTMIGGEAITNPGCEREYSATSCVKCDLLSINVHDYFNCTMTPANPRDFFPDHIKFLCQCPFLRKFPKEKLIQHAENNIMLVYFHPKTVVEYNMRESKWVYVVWWGACRTVCEINPNGKAVESRIKKSRILPKQKFDLMEDRMTEPPLRDKSPIRTIKKSSLWKRDVKKTIQEEVSRLKYQQSVPYNTNELVELKAKREKISSLLRAKQKHDLRKQVEAASLRVGQIETKLGPTSATPNNVQGGVSLPSILSTTSFRKSVSSGTKPLVFATEHTSDQLPIKQRKQSDDEDGDIITQSDKSNSVKFSKYTIAGANMHLEKLYANAIVKESQISESSFCQNVELAFSRDWHRRGDIFGGKSLISENSLLQELTTTRERAASSTGHDSVRERSTVGGKSASSSEETPRMTARKSTTEMQYELDHQEIDKARKKRTLSLRISPKPDKEKPKHSRWKLKKNLVKGDEVGFEWVNLNDGKFRPGPEPPALLSDGCELVILRKSLLVDILGHDGNRSDFQ